MVSLVNSTQTLGELHGLCSPWVAKKVRHDCCNDSSPLQHKKHKRKENIPTLSLKLVLLCYLIQKRHHKESKLQEVIFIINIDVKIFNKNANKPNSVTYLAPYTMKKVKFSPSVNLVFII